MMNKTKLSIAKRALDVSPSLTLAITAKAKKMQQDGIEVIGFGAGEPDFNTPDYIITAAKDALDRGYTKYTPSSGILPLRQAICNKLKRDNKLTYDPGQIVVSNGAKHSLSNAFMTIVQEGDEVIVPSPYWLTYPELIRLAGGIPVYVDCKDNEGFVMTPEQLTKAITPKTKAVIINSPSNPTGGIYTETQLRELAKIITKADIFVVSDEIYEHLIYGGKTHFSIAAVSEDLYNRTIVVNGFSKTYAMTGWRIGYTASNTALASAMDNMQSHTTSNANTIAQYASVEALSGKGEKEFLAKLVTTFDERRRLMYNRLSKMKHISTNLPEGAFYFMVDITALIGKSVDGTKIMGAQTIAEILLDKAQIAVVPGEAFGAGDYIRLSYALSPSDINKGLDRLEQWLDAIN